MHGPHGTKAVFSRLPRGCEPCQTDATVRRTQGFFRFHLVANEMAVELLTRPVRFHFFSWDVLQGSELCPDSALTGERRDCQGIVKN